ncbi:hypothetical protein QAD02_011837 [Eretmocerus hayati]|uniref:Uncharacterized protein n=1 Tax=Eretmocerus hayati TaxID=131215 RepID=A0ACC2NZ37_9HYME|nr:hypothetical protein QAD02_011837 [Eretmocerus hayati]
MEIEELNDALEILDRAIENFPHGAEAVDEVKPIQLRIVDMRQHLRHLNARHLTLKAVKNLNFTPDPPVKDLSNALEELNTQTTDYLINTRVLKLSCQSKAIQDILYHRKSDPVTQKKVQVCLDKLFTLNQRLMSKKEKKKKLMELENNLKMECHHAIYNHQEFLKQKETKMREHIQNQNQNEAENFRDQLDRAVRKVNTTKRLIVNCIAAAGHILHNDRDVVEMLAKHRELINHERLKEMTEMET